MTTPDGKFPIYYIDGHTAWLDAQPPKLEENSEYDYIVTEAGLVYASKEDIQVFKARQRAMKGDWTWHQEVELRDLLAKQARQARLDEAQEYEAMKQAIRDKLADRNKIMIMDQQATYERVISHVNERIKQDVGGIHGTYHGHDYGMTKDGSFDIRQCLCHPPKTPLTLEQLKRRRKRNLTFSVPITAAMFISSQYVSSLPNLVQWIWTLTLMPACAFFLFRGIYLQTKVERAERAEKNKPVPQPIIFNPPPKPKTPYERARDFYVETGKQRFLDDMLELVTIEEVDYTL